MALLRQPGPPRAEPVEAHSTFSGLGDIALPLAARPLGLMGGYLDDEELTAQAMREG
jgi:acetyl-CoA synthetase